MASSMLSFSKSQWGEPSFYSTFYSLYLVKNISQELQGVHGAKRNCWLSGQNYGSCSPTTGPTNWLRTLAKMGFLLLTWRMILDSWQQKFWGWGWLSRALVLLCYDFKDSLYSFHDCIRYADGEGGCDGCLNWHGVGHRLQGLSDCFNLSLC